MASALLGLPKVLQLMRDEKLRLSEAENLLRLEVETALKHIQETALLNQVKSAWAPLDFRGLILYGLQGRERSRAKKRGRQNEKQFRTIWSWMLDAGAQKGEKLRIALGQRSERQGAGKIRAQIEEDSKGVLEALRILEGKLPCDSARWNGKPFNGERAKLLSSAVRLSLEVSKHNDTLKTHWELMEKWQEKQREAQAEVLAHKKALTDEEMSWRARTAPGRTGRQKRS